MVHIQDPKVVPIQDPKVVYMQVIPRWCICRLYPRVRYTLVGYPRVRYTLVGYPRWCISWYIPWCIASLCTMVYMPPVPPWVHHGGYTATVPGTTATLAETGTPR